MEASKTRGRRGPRTFDRDEALEKAMRLFWRQGYEGTSLNDLTHAIGISPPSLYAAFENKAGLYREAVDRYAASPERQLDTGGASTLVEATRNLLRRAADRATDPGGQIGCMISFGLIEHGPGAEEVAAIASAHRAAMKRRIVELLSPWLAGEVADRKASLLMAVLAGLAIAARDGATRADLYNTVAEMLAPLSGGSPA